MRQCGFEAVPRLSEDNGRPQRDVQSDAAEGDLQCGIKSCSVTFVNVGCRGEDKIQLKRPFRMPKGRQFCLKYLTGRSCMRKCFLSDAEDAQFMQQSPSSYRSILFSVQSDGLSGLLTWTPARPLRRPAEGRASGPRCRSTRSCAPSRRGSRRT